jgi:signal transduction histidine kinase
VETSEAGAGGRWKRIRGDLLLGLAFWSAVDLFFFSRLYVQIGVAEKPPFTARQIFGPHLLETVADVALWTLYTPLILHLALRFRLGRRLLPWAVHLGASLPLAVVSSLVGWVVVTATWPVPDPALARWLASTVHNNVQVYWMAVVAALALDYWRRARERELRASQLETQLARAHLQALEMQLQPHFLFNTLNSISELVHEDPHAADRTITRLGDLLRMSIDRQAGQEVPLARELEFVGAYLEIERTRFHDRLTVETRVDPGALDALVPSLILQPLVENAIRHGVAPRARPARIVLGAERDGDVLRLTVADDGRGLPPRVRERVGLGNTRTRLTQLYGDRHRFEVAAAPGGGTLATVEVPYRRAADAPAREAPRLVEAR